MLVLNAVTYYLCSYAKLALLCCPFFVYESKFLKNPFFNGKNNNKIKKWDFLKIQNYGVDIYCKVSTARKNIQRLIPYV